MSYQGIAIYQLPAVAVAGIVMNPAMTSMVSFKAMICAINHKDFRTALINFEVSVLIFLYAVQRTEVAARARYRQLGCFKPEIA